MFLFNLRAKMFKTRSKELYDPSELWTYATYAQPEDNTDCEYVAHWVAVTRDDVDAVMAKTEALEHFAGWVIRSSKFSDEDGEYILDYYDGEPVKEITEKM